MEFVKFSPLLAIGSVKHSLAHGQISKAHGTAHQSSFPAFGQESRMPLVLLAIGSKIHSKAHGKA
jgi:hypothetical protein